MSEGKPWICDSCRRPDESRAGEILVDRCYSELYRLIGGAELDARPSDRIAIRAAIEQLYRDTVRLIALRGV